MRRVRTFLVVGAAALLMAWAAPARCQSSEEPDPCADAGGQIAATACWAREADRADVEMREAYNALLQKLTPRAAGALKKAQKLWLEARAAHLELLLAIANPSNEHRWQDSICLAIARRELARERTRELRRLLEPPPDQACPL
jgi:uncharacterized protein YecT (DUF1311 family)